MTSGPSYLATHNVLIQASAHILNVNILKVSTRMVEIGEKMSRKYRGDSITGELLGIVMNKIGLTTEVSFFAYCFF
jgi:hypothetical protein